MLKLSLSLLWLLLLSTAGRAQLRVDSLVKALETGVEDTNRVILYRMLTGIVANTTPSEAIRYGKSGVELGKKLGYVRGVAGCYLNLSFAYGAASRIDSGILFIDSAIVWSKKAGEPARISLAYLNRGDFQMQLRNLRQALADCDTALHYAELANSDDRRARILQTLGSVYFTQQNYAESGRYYLRAAGLYDRLGNKKMAAIVASNLGNIDKRTGHYDAAIGQFNKALSLAQEAGDEISLAMYYGNLSDAYLSAGQYQKAEESARLGMRQAVRQGNEVQQANIYNHLAQVSLHRKNYPEAIAAGLKSYAITGNNALTEAQHAAAQVLAEAYSASGNHKDAYFYLQRSEALHDTLARQKYDEDIAALETSFKVKEKNSEIALLNKNRELQEQRLYRQQLIVTAALLLLALLLAGIFLLVSRHRLRQRMAEMELRNAIAADLHDEVGSSLSSICMLSEMASGSGPDSRHEILRKVTTYSRETMEKMGDIVWMIKPAGDDGLDLRERMERFLYEMCGSKGIAGSFDGDEFQLPKLDMHKRKALYLIFKETVNNALKYASAGAISVSIRREDEAIVLKIADDGTGFDPLSVRKGNGLTNLENRAREVGGSVTILSAPGKGTAVTCRIPG